MFFMRVNQSVTSVASLQAIWSIAQCRARQYSNDLKRLARERAPLPVIALLRLWRTGDWRSILTFLLSDDVRIPMSDRFKLIRRFQLISSHVPCEHLQSEMCEFIRALLGLPAEIQGLVVECGCYKGGSTAKLSVAAELVGRELVIFDSFEGLPEHGENQGNTIWGTPVNFSTGDYCGSLEEVAANVEKYGEIGSCTFVKGYFRNTLPMFRKPIAAAYLDVDLAASTMTCLQYIWPLLSLGGILFSHDGHLLPVLDALSDEHFWQEQLGSSIPEIHGFGMEKLIWMQKTVASNGP